MMKLISLTCDQSSFRSLFFRPKGISIIVGDASEEGASSNGVGKTLALKLVHHCLGADVKKDSALATNIPDWVFCLKFELNKSIHEISRRGDGKEIKLDDEGISITKLKEWLNDSGPFIIDKEKNGITFRTLYKRFTREIREDQIDPLRLKKEQDYQALTRALYLLGTDISLVIKKIILRDEQLRIENRLKFLKADQSGTYRNILGGMRPEVSLKKLQDEISKLQNDITEMVIAKNYEDIKLEADRLTVELREKEAEIALLDYQLSGIDSGLKQSPDLNRQALLSFYDGLKDLFKVEALRDFEDVESFHKSLTKRRQERLYRDKEKLTSRKEEIEDIRNNIARNRDLKLQYLSGKQALNDYEAVVRKLAFKEQVADEISNMLEEYGNLEDEAISIKQEMADQDKRAASYLKTQPLEWADKKFRTFIGRLYPQEAASIGLYNNINENKLRYNLSVDVQGQDSDGINAMRIMCFDWIIFMYGSHHNMGHLWHDNGLFDHVDPNQRAKWLSIAMAALCDINKQYIVSLNTENYTSLLEGLSEEERHIAENSVIMELQGNKPEHKLLGIQIGPSGS
ncbi:DUF2326 domain-containing protein [Aristophania vespae]|uniref:DUF2326 domain-containing protein n=1 Tax=Aristophania vespae TaxID=2697033 RepID=UPI0023513C74|nr:DUF2326 domain-containing protein [Aristophania vespae]UMM63122.1 hypothetical protein DM15PD_00760 [Aristophania vespae]